MTETRQGESMAEVLANAGAGLSLEVDGDGVAVLEFDQPGSEHNRFTPELLERFVALVAEVRLGVEADDIRGLVITSGKRDSFIAGMDVESIAGVRSAAVGAAGSRQGQAAFAAVAELKVPSVAAINGTCLGGATELALACDYRLAADSAAVEIGLPEVNLGILPGFGGSQRLPRLVSLERSLPMILTGRTVTARRARRIGLVDGVVPTAVLLSQAKEWTRRGRRVAAAHRAPENRTWFRRLRRFLFEGNPLGRALVLRLARRGVEAATKGHYPAPATALRVVGKGLSGSLDAGLQLESEALGELVVSDVARNLLGIFFMRQAARRPAPAGTAGVRKVKRLGVIGAGTMGGGIAQLAASKDVAVRIKDIAIEPLEAAMVTAHRGFERRRRSGKWTAREVQRRMGLISPTLDSSGFRHADLIIEAVVENLAVKHQVLAAVEAAAGDHTVIATNTSSLTLAAMATPLRDASRFVGLHFFNPVHRMPLVEVVKGGATSPETVAVTTAFAVMMGKVPVVVADAPGFFVNRVLGPYLNEAMLLLQEGNTIAAIDGALERFGMPMGPLRLLDEIGLDVSAKVSGQLAPVFAGRMPSTQVIDKVLELGRLGRKGHSGFYFYPDPGKPVPDTEIERAVGAEGEALDEAVIVDRCVMAILNEASEALALGIISSAQAADLALVMGTGFAPFRGGVFRYAESLGLEAVCERMEQLAESFGERFKPASLLRSKGPDGAGFYPGDWPRKVDSL